jgi:hypothetical protein
MKLRLWKKFKNGGKNRYNPLRKNLGKLLIRKNRLRKSRLLAAAAAVVVVVVLTAEIVVVLEEVEETLLVDEGEDVIVVPLVEDVEVDVIGMEKEEMIK